MSKIDIADTVHHKPTAEDWVVARVTDMHLWPAGWPPGRANLADCELLQKATDAQREDMMRMLRKMPASDERHLSDNPC
jgi:hypothetical protein